MPIKYLKPTTLKNKTVLLRVDVNVPIENGAIADDFRVRAIVPTIQMLMHGGNKVIVCGHLGRPKGKDGKLSLKPVAEHLAKLLGIKFLSAGKSIPELKLPHLIFYGGSIMEDHSRKELSAIAGGNVIVLENIRFYEGEENNEAMLAKKISGLADVYINDAFSVSHRKAASVFAITKYLPSYAGPLLEKEIKSLSALLGKVKRPFVLMMGGIKISDKAQTLEFLGPKTDKILLAGGLANLFFLSKGLEVGKSKVEKGAEKLAWQMERNFKDKLVLPVDVVVANENMDKNSIRVTTPYEVGKKEVILDIGPKSILVFANELKQAQTVVWNGPLGHFEVKPFHTATMALARIIGGISTRKAFGVVGGGETADAVRQSHQLDYIDHVSTGGGAMLEFLAGKKLPGIEALK